MPRVFSNLSTLGYHTPGHPESPARVEKSHERLKAAGHRVETPSQPAEPGDVSLVHDAGHLKHVASGGYPDRDTPHYPGIDAIALTSLSGALAAASAAAAGEPAFSLMRPPGHHAGKNRVSGFCYLNNIVVATAKLLKDKKASRVAILDIDVHHGDGSEELCTGKSDILFCSLHQFPLYPGTGEKSHDNCINFPLPPGTGEKEFLLKAEEGLGRLLDFKPDILAVSAGFDTYKEDPIAQLKLDKPSYRALGRLIAGTGLRRFAVLEGGYSDELPALIERFLDGFFS